MSSEKKSNVKKINDKTTSLLRLLNFQTSNEVIGDKSCKSTISMGGEILYDLSIYTVSDVTVTVNVTPFHGDKTHLVQHWSSIYFNSYDESLGVFVPTDKYVEQYLEEFESFLRALSIHRGVMDERDFPTNDSLKTCVALVKTAIYCSNDQSNYEFILGKLCSLETKFKRKSALSIIDEIKELNSNGDEILDRMKFLVKLHTNSRLNRLLSNIDDENHVSFISSRGQTNEEVEDEPVKLQM